MSVGISSERVQEIEHSIRYHLDESLVLCIGTFQCAESLEGVSLC